MRTLVAVIFVCFVLSSCKPSGEGRPTPPQGPGPNLVLISLDTLRADHLGCYGYERPTSPHIDRFAESAWLFVNTISPSGRTTEAHMSMFTGLYPSVHQIRTTKLAGSLRVLDPSIPTLASHLKERGFTTVGFHGGGNVDSVFGFDRGFERYERADIEQAVEWLSSRATRDRFFLFFHTYATHDPYTPQPPFDTMFGAAYHGSIIHDEAELERLADSNKWPKVSRIYWQNFDATDPRDVARLVDLYDGEIAQLDAELQKLFAAIESWAPNTVVVVLSDHGEEFGEHGKFRHDQLYNEVLRVPLIIRDPQRPGGRRVEAPVNLIDLAPTLLDMLGLEPVKGMQGKSFWRDLDRDRSGDPLLSELLMEGGWFTLQTRKRKVISRSSGPEWYDLAADPGERSNLIDETTEGEPFRNLSALLEQERDRNEKLSGLLNQEEMKAPLPERAEQELRALGYIE